MPIATRTFRVFVSSTFEDLKEERNALQSEVFPKLRTLCEQYGARFQAIDLRWGVRDEASLDQQTMEICLREIRRCKATGVRPNFIALIGDRYGWRPLPVMIPASEFDLLKPHMPACDVAAQADQWYRLDENAVPPEYCLQPRTGEFVDPSVWNPVEQTLFQALATAARAAGMSEKELIKYEASATHQEILAGLGDSEEDRQHVFGFVRRPTRDSDQRLEALKSHLQVHEFGAGDMKGLCELVLTQLTKVIKVELKRFEDRPALDLEIEAHDRFAQGRCRIFVGRDNVLKVIADYIGGPERRPLVLHGESGSGKSAVMAKASQKYGGPGRVIRRFIGASPESASGHALLTSLCRQITPGETPVDYAQLENAFRERLSVATEPLVLFIDALDQLAASDPARVATWLPLELPPHAKVIVSTTEDVERLPEGLPTRLERMAQSEGGQALDAFLRDAGRKLQPWQRETVLAHFERCGLPLYLKLAAEESRLWKSYTPEDSCTLDEGVAGIIETLFDRLASNSNHGPTLVERSLGYLAAARYGLTEDEMLDVLTADDTVWSEFDQRKHHEVSERRLPAVVWSRLSLDLEPYLTERAAPGGTVIAFYHRQLAERAGVGLHAELVRYFLGRPVSDTRRLVELPFQQRAAHQWKEAEATLLDCEFLFAKVAAGLVLDLDADYQALFQEDPESSRALRLVSGALLLSLHVVATDPLQFASQMVGRMLVHRDKPDVARFVDEFTAAAPRPWLRPLYPALHPSGTALLRTLEAPSDVYCVAVTPDGKRAVSCEVDTLTLWDLQTGRALRTLEGNDSAVGVVVTPDGRRAVSASFVDNTLKVWDLDTGRVLRTLEDHSSSVIGVAVTPDGRRAVSASLDETLKVWDLETGHALRSLEGHSDHVVGVAVTPDGRLVVSASKDTTLKVWDLDTGRLLHTLEGHLDAVRAVVVTPDGRQAVSASRDKTLRVWDLGDGCVSRTLLGHSGAVYGVAVTPNGKWVVSASQDKTLRVWDLETGRAVCTLLGHSDAVNGVAVTPNGKWVVSASSDKTLKVWDPESGGALDTEGHSSAVNGVAVTTNGKWVVSASSDKTLKVWDVTAGRALRTLEGHSDSVNSVAITPNGRQAVSASNDKTLKVWDLRTGQALRTLEGHSYQVLAVAVTPDGRRAVSGSSDGTLKVWDLNFRLKHIFTTRRAPRTLVGHLSAVLGVTVTPNGKWVISASSDATLRVWDVEADCVPLKVKGLPSTVFLSVAVTPDGSRAVSSSSDGTLKVWDLGTGRALRTLTGHSGSVRGVSVAPDGKRATSVSDDSTVKVWELETGLLVATFYCEASALCCAFADARRIVAGDEGGRVYFLTLEEYAPLTVRSASGLQMSGFQGKIESSQISRKSRPATPASPE